MLIIILDRFSIACFNVFDTVEVHMLDFKYEVEGFSVYFSLILYAYLQNNYIFLQWKRVQRLILRFSLKKICCMEIIDENCNTNFFSIIVP